MLVLTRKRGERIVIAPNIDITIVEVRDNKVLLGVTAPRQIVVNRLEIQRKRQAGEFGNQSAQGRKPHDINPSTETLNGVVQGKRPN